MTGTETKTMTRNDTAAFHAFVSDPINAAVTCDMMREAERCIAFYNAGFKQGVKKAEAANNSVNRTA